MGKLITIIIVAVLGLAGWQWISGFMACSRVDLALRDVADLGKGMDHDAAIKSILEMSEKHQVFLTREDVRVDISLGETATSPERAVQRGGIQTINKRMYMEADHRHAVLGIKMKDTHKLAQNYTISAQIETPRTYEMGD